MIWLLKRVQGLRDNLPYKSHKFFPQLPLLDAGYTCRIFFNPKTNNLVEVKKLCYTYCVNHWRYKNLSIFAISVVFAFFLSRFEALHAFLLNLGEFGYIGAFFAGILFVSTFTVATGAVILLVLAEKLSAVEIGIVAGFGAVVGDLTIFRIIKDNLSNELQQIYNNIDRNHHLQLLLHSRYFSWTLPVIGAIIIASPFPDEIGISLMGIAKMNTYKFIAVSFLLNAIGIFLVVTASAFIKP